MVEIPDFPPVIGMSQKNVCTVFDENYVRQHLETILHDDPLSEVGVVQAGEAIWVVGLSIYGHIEQKLQQFAEAHGCGLTICVAKGRGRDYCVFS